MSNREFLMLAHTYDVNKHTIGGWFVSTKLDGQRAFWDGGATRGTPKTNVPWANCNKDERYTVPPVSTGLWSRYGNVIHAPDWWLDLLPKGVCLDGELYIDRNEFQTTRSIVSTIVPGDGWKRVKYCVFDTPAAELVFESGRINNPQFKQKEIDEKSCLALLKDQKAVFARPKQFDRCFDLMQTSVGINYVVQHVEQVKLPFQEKDAIAKLANLLLEETSQGGEGLMLRDPNSYWNPRRSKTLLKVKPLLDAEATVTGYIWGEGKLEGLMGALCCVTDDGQSFNLSGFTDKERILYGADTQNPGSTASQAVTSNKFPIGSRISFKFMGWTNDNKPREPRYWRKT